MSDWIRTKDWLPSKENMKDLIGNGVVDNNHADCYIYINNCIEERPFNFYHGCWDDRDYDDFQYEAKEPTHWMLANPLPKPPQTS